MSILINKDTRVLVQGITGHEGLGNGSKDMIVDNCQVVFNDEPTGHEMMHILDFRKGQGFADISG